MLNSCCKVTDVKFPLATVIQKIDIKYNIDHEPEMSNYDLSTLINDKVLYLMENNEM